MSKNLIKFYDENDLKDLGELFDSNLNIMVGHYQRKKSCISIKKIIEQISSYYKYDEEDVRHCLKLANSKYVANNNVEVILNGKLVKRTLFHKYFCDVEKKLRICFKKRIEKQKMTLKEYREYEKLPDLFKRWPITWSERINI